MWWAGDSENAPIGNQGCPHVLHRGRQFYSKCLPLQALVLEVRQLTSFLANQYELTDAHAHKSYAVRYLIHASNDFSQ